MGLLELATGSLSLCLKCVVHGDAHLSPGQNEGALEWLVVAETAQVHDGHDLALCWLPVILLDLVLQIGATAVLLDQKLLEIVAPEVGEPLDLICVTQERVVDGLAVGQLNQVAFRLRVLLRGGV